MKRLWEEDKSLFLLVVIEVPVFVYLFVGFVVSVIEAI